jgi:predicted flap endonuclease-1-like 5' DNA nuclease
VSAWWWLVLGLLLGWLIELAIDYRYWRRHAKLEAERVARRDAELAARAATLDEREQAVAQRDEEVTALQATLAAKDADLMAQAKRIDERGEEVTRLEQAMDKRRADLDRVGTTLNEREKDIAARTDALKTREGDAAARLEKLEAGESDVARRVAVVSNRESAMQNWETRILAREHEVGDKESELVRKAAAADALRAELDAAKGLMRRQYQTPEGTDDLQAIEGIGPKIASLLRNADISTFERLSETSLGELSRLLETGGPRFGLADPLTWAEQAAMLFSGDYVGFEQLKEELIGGVRRDAQAAAEPAAAVPAGADRAGGPEAESAASDGPLFESATSKAGDADSGTAGTGRRGSR